MEVTTAIILDGRAALNAIHAHSSPLTPLKAIPRNAETGPDIVTVEDAEADSVDGEVNTEGIWNSEVNIIQVCTIQLSSFGNEVIPVVLCPVVILFGGAMSCCFALGKKAKAE